MEHKAAVARKQLFGTIAETFPMDAPRKDLMKFTQRETGASEEYST